MNKIIKVCGWQLSDDVRNSIKMIVDQMEKHNFSITSNVNAVRLFSRLIPECYKRNGTIIISRTRTYKPRSVVVLKPEYQIERIDDYSFKIKMK